VTQTADTAKETKPELVTATIDGREVSVPKGTLIIRAAEQAGIQIPRFCDHPLLAPAGACRQCLVDVAMPQASCTMEVTPGMQVATQHTSEVADKAQHGIMEFLLVNHPLDCPVCDKGGECPLQNQAMSNGRAESRFVDVKRTFPKPIAVSTQILLDRDRCILCQRCTRFSSQIAGDAFIALQGRGAGSPGREVHALNGSQIGTFDADVLGFSHESEVHDSAIPYAGPDGAPGTTVGHATAPVGAAEMDTSGRPFSSYFSGNTIQICPVGALTSAMYRFRSRPFDLVSTPSVAEHDASGSAIRVDNRRGKVVRRLAGNDPEVNEEWITDKDRFAFHWQDAPDRLRMPLVRDQATGVMHETSWSHALSVAGEELARAAADGGVGLLPGGHLTLEDSYAWSKFARTVLGTNDIDFRARPGSDEESAVLAAGVASTGLGVTYSDVETAGRVLLVALEPEEECGTLFLRLRKGVLARTTAVTTLAPFASRGTTKLSADLVEVVPGGEAAALDALDAGLVEQLSGPGAVILLGERAAVLPGTLSAAVRLAERTGARLQWVPRRAGERGALEAGALPGLLPGARPVTDPTARADAGAIWHVDSLPSAPGRDHRAILAAAGTRTRPCASWARRTSSSSSRCAATRSRSWRTSCCRSRRRSRRPDPSSTGRAGSARSARSSPPTRCPTASSCATWPPRWGTTSAFPPSPSCTPSSRSSTRGRRGRRRRARPRERRRPPRPAQPCSRPGASSSTRAAARTASRTSPAPRTSPSSGSRPPPRRRSAPRTARASA
jgi:NADH-quinone oxidoreductase subunit G